jgi:hypothetical protein
VARCCPLVFDVLLRRAAAAHVLVHLECSYAVSPTKSQALAFSRASLALALHRGLVAFCCYLTFVFVGLQLPIFSRPIWHFHMLGNGIARTLRAIALATLNQQQRHERLKFLYLRSLCL